MSLKRIAAETPWLIDIHWSRPALYENARRNAYDARSWLYMLFGYSGKSERKIFYIGKAVRSFIASRLGQADHLRRLKRLKKEHPNHQFRVTQGSVSVRGGNITPRRIDQIESMLIYAFTEKNSHITNKKKVWSHGITVPYTIRNLGYGNPLPKEIHHGVFVC